MSQTARNPSPGFRNHPEHTITVEPLGKHVTVRSNGVTIASSDSALLLKEHTYPGVIYIPFADIDFGKLSATENSTHCPFKGDASYWSVKDGAADAMWAYQDPYDEMAEIKGYGAFYPNRVEIETQ
ncbi:DUF427 domain-containing protein [Mesorhizobium sp. BAC0120]|uniref:DUF427 domain-containing protein n=1 Tax=Mesorhizobium sp. BAC0120 TaxID=3090670 RepID=UPI00298C0A36|nr:DUF427 domain-containing protein [Mesorhizobium sp. BAC0120]MDW6020945.1 DUF427 domain-containing protein [Mesorhizobium sp. BAC0120]